MICPHCGKEIVTPASADPVNAAGPYLFLPNINAAAPSLLSTFVHGSHLWINTVCAAGAAQPGITHYITFGGNDKR